MVWRWPNEYNKKATLEGQLREGLEYFRWKYQQEPVHLRVHPTNHEMVASISQLATTSATYVSPTDVLIQ